LDRRGCRTLSGLPLVCRRQTEEPVRNSELLLIAALNSS
jgi:hypothetical protein